jgi:hypothetical protein
MMIAGKESVVDAVEEEYESDRVKNLRELIRTQNAQAAQPEEQPVAAPVEDKVAVRPVNQSKSTLKLK